MTSNEVALGIEVLGEMTIKNGKLTKPSVEGAYPSVPPVPVSVSGGTLTLENVIIDITGKTYDAGVTVNTGTLNLNEGTVINVGGISGETYAIWVLGMKNNTINFNGGKIVINAEEDAAALGIFNYGLVTVNANSGSIKVNAGAEHYAMFAYLSNIEVTVGAGFEFIIDDGASKYSGSVIEK